jgi:hypothetical protein
VTSEIVERIFRAAKASNRTLPPDRILELIGPHQDSPQA